MSRPGCFDTLKYAVSPLPLTHTGIPLVGHTASGILLLLLPLLVAAMLLLLLQLLLLLLL